MGLLKFLRGSSGGAPPPVSATATWEQAAASWDATASERFTSTAAFVQAAATWDAAALERLASTAEWVQAPAQWSATAVSAEDVTAEGSWTQAAATWAGLASTSVVPSERPRIGLPVRVRFHVNSIGSWEQPPASWAAEMTVTRRDADIEELMLIGAI
jgi:hypothetical protein